MSERATGWMLWLGGGAFVLVSTLGVLWWKLPTWQPELVARHSPFVDPVLRSEAHLLDADRIILPRLRGSWGASAVPYLLRRLDATDPGTRLHALRWLAVTADPRVVPAYLDILDRGTFAEVAFACEGLAGVWPAPVADIAVIARRRVAASPNDVVLGEFAALLTLHLDAALLPLALDLASASRANPQAGRRLFLLAKLPLSDQLAALTHPDPVVARLALQGIGSAWSRGGHLDPGLLPALFSLADREDPIGRDLAMTMIAALLGEAAGPRLARAFADPVEAVALRGLELVGRIPGPSTLPWLRTALTGERAALHRPAAELLAASDQPEAWAILAAAVANPDARVRELAAAAQIRSSGSP